MIRLKHQENQTSFVNWRFTFLCVCSLLAAVALMLRVGYLQMIHPDKLVREGAMHSLRVQNIPTARAIISDRAGRLLAVSVPVNTIWAAPKELNDHGGISADSRWKALSNVLLTPFDQLSSRINANPKGRFAYLARQVNPAVGDYIHKLKLQGIYLRQELRHYYPASQVIVHLIGVTNIDSQDIEDIEKKI